MVKCSDNKEPCCEFECSSYFLSSSITWENTFWVLESQPSQYYDLGAALMCTIGNLCAESVCLKMQGAILVSIALKGPIETKEKSFLSSLVSLGSLLKSMSFLDLQEEAIITMAFS